MLDRYCCSTLYGNNDVVRVRSGLLSTGRVPIFAYTLCVCALHAYCIVNVETDAWRDVALEKKQRGVVIHIGEEMELIAVGSNALPTSRVMLRLRKVSVF